MTLIADQQLVVHAYAPIEGPVAAPAYADLLGLWAGCQHRLGMRDAVEGTELPVDLPDSPDRLPLVDSLIEEAAVAARERAGSGDQVLVRRHYDVVNLSAHLTGGDWPTLDNQWSAVEAGHTDSLLGLARVYTGRLTDGSLAGLGTTAVGLAARDLLPEPSAASRWWNAGAIVAPGLAVWELTPPDDRAVARRFVAIGDPQAADLLGAWVWSRGDPAIPPLARYLLHAAKVRYQTRVFLRDAPALRQAGDAVRGSLPRMRRTVEIALSNMAAALGTPTPGGPFAADRAQAESLATRLADTEFYLETQAPPPPPPPAAPEADITRRVFVIHGRDGQVRDGLFGFLTAIGLAPLEWEEVVALTGSAVPTLTEAILNGLRMAQAAVVVLTPEDIVSLHPSLHEADEDPAETRRTLQPRPNVLIELGMALALFPRQTVICRAGSIKRFADTDGLNYIRLHPSEEVLRKIANRLTIAGCPVDLSGPGWNRLDWLRDLDAYGRGPSDPSV